MSEIAPHIPASAYCYLFNITRFAFPYRETLSNFCTFFDEVVVATIPDEDGSPELLRELAKTLPNLRVVETDISLSNNRFDGLLKTAALKATTHAVKVIADCDESFPPSQKGRWQNLYHALLREDHRHIDGFMVPVLDLWGSRDRIRCDQPIGQKFRVHKASVVERGPVPGAIWGNRIRTEMSDTTEPLNADGNLARFASFVPPLALTPILSRALAAHPFVVHEGYLSLEARARINREFWKEHWENRSGKVERVETEAERLACIPTVEHGLSLE